MSIINLMLETVILLVCSTIQFIGILIEGIAKVLFKTVKILERAHDRVLDCRPKKKRNVNIDVAL